MTTTNEKTMETGKRSDWLLFLVFTAITLLLLLFLDEFFWLGLPFMLTYLVKALKSM
jgi:hypothetical protein